MARQVRDRIVRRLDEAEGYLLLDMPARSLEILQSRSDWASMQFEASLLTGEALRALGHYREALAPLETAAKLRPGDVAVAVCLGWCYKRTHRLAQAIDALERALREHPDEALVHYNLACYWSLAGNSERALDALGTALDLDSRFRDLVENEADFDAVRGHPGFQRLVGPHAPQA